MDEDFCFLNNQITIHYVNEMEGTEDTFHYEDGLIDFMKDINNDEELETKSDIVYFKGTYEDMEAEVCLQLTTEKGERLFNRYHFLQNA